MAAQPFQAPSKEAIRHLLAGEGGMRVSIYLPVPRRPGFGDVRRFPASYDRLLRRAAERMDELGVDATESGELVRLLETANVQLGDLHHATSGIAVFAGPMGLRSFSLIDRVDASVHVGRTLRIRPLLASAQKECRYRVVSLSLNEVELYEGDARALHGTEEEDVPSSLDEALGSQLTDATLQFHSGASRGGAPIFHGHGGADRERGVDKHRFYHVLAGALSRAWGGDDGPIVLVADRAHVGRFRKVADLPNLLDEVLIGNPHGWSGEELHARVFSLVRDRLDRERMEALSRAEAARSCGRGVSELSAAASAAVEGRVARLFADSRRRIERHIDPEGGVVRDAFGDEDALDELCGLVLARGGDALVLDRGDVTNAPELLAELRG